MPSRRGRPKKIKQNNLSSSLQTGEEDNLSRERVENDNLENLSPSKRASDLSAERIWKNEEGEAQKKGREVFSALRDSQNDDGFEIEKNLANNKDGSGEEQDFDESGTKRDGIVEEVRRKKEYPPLEPLEEVWSQEIEEEEEEVEEGKIVGDGKVGELGKDGEEVGGCHLRSEEDEEQIESKKKRAEVYVNEEEEEAQDEEEVEDDSFDRSDPDFAIADSSMEEVDESLEDSFGSDENVEKFDFQGCDGEEEQEADENQRSKWKLRSQGPVLENKSIAEEKKKRAELEVQLSL